MTDHAATVLVAGSLHYDIMVDAPDRPRKGETVTGRSWRPKCGGKGGNQAVAAARRAKTAMVGAVGDDDFGRTLLANLDRAGVDRAAVAVRAGAGSGMSVAIFDDGGDYGAVIVSGANLTASPDQLDDARLAAAAVLVLQNEIPEAVNAALARRARQHGVRVLLNAAPARAFATDLPDDVDILVVNAIVDSGAMLIDRANVTLARASVQASGRASATDSDISGVVSVTDLTAAGFGLRGGLDGKVHFQGQPTQGRLSVDATATGLAVGQTQVDLLLRGISHLTADLDLSPAGVGVRQLDVVNAQMTLDATGTLNGTERRLQLEHRIADLGLLYPDFPGPLVTTGTAVQDANGYVVDLSARGPGQIDAQVKGRVASNFRNVDLTIAGTASAGLANNLAAPRSLSGPMRFDLRMVGPVSLASLSGPVSISGGQLADPGQTFGLKDVSVSAQLAAGQAKVTVGAAVSTGGHIGVTGTVGLTTPYPANLDLSVQSVILRDPSLYTTTVDGALTFIGPILGAAVIAGQPWPDGTIDPINRLWP